MPVRETHTYFVTGAPHSEGYVLVYTTKGRTLLRSPSYVLNGASGKFWKRHVRMFAQMYIRDLAAMASQGITR